MSQLTRNSDDHDDLPLMVTRNNSEPPRHHKARKVPRIVMLPLAFLILFTGAVIGIYIQPPALKMFMELTGLVPGGGTRTPIAIPSSQSELSAQPKIQTIRSVVALGKLAPDGDVVTLAMPYGAGDARVEEIHIKIGQRITRGDTVAVLDSVELLQSAVEVAQANVAVKEAALAQTNSNISASLNEGLAVLASARAASQVAARNLERDQELFKKGLSTQSSLDSAVLKARETKQDVEKAEATLSRYDSQDIDDQPDILVAARNLDVARVDLSRARQELARGTVTAPVSGTVLDIHVRPGEKPGNTGIIDIGNTDRMTAELEVYQSDIARVRVGQHVELTSDALDASLTGLVSTIGFTVGRQTQIGDDPAANTDARVIKVTVQLDDESSADAARLTFLEVMARIAVEEDP